MTHSFRNLADKEYISARSLYRLELPPIYLWMSLQAIEKYLKAIALYNLLNTKDLSHDIHKAWERVLSIKDIQFDFPKSVSTFIENLNHNGRDRYLTKNYWVRGFFLKHLDEAVWNIRRYCQDFKLEGDEGFKERMSYVNNLIWKEHPHRFKLHGGYLEQILASSRSQSRSTLLWKNFYYGVCNRRTIKNFPNRFCVEAPVYDYFPKAYRIFQRLAKV